MEIQTQEEFYFKPSSSPTPPRAVADDVIVNGQLLPLDLLSSLDTPNTTRSEPLSRDRAKSKSFSLLRRRSTKESQDHPDRDRIKTKKPRFDVGLFLSKYIAVFSKEKRKKDFRGNRAEYSARASPVVMGDSSMEELQAAIQAAIAHCKNSVAMADTKAMVS